MKRFSFYLDQDDSQLFNFETETWNEAREQCAAMLGVDPRRVHWMPDIAIDNPDATFENYRAEKRRALEQIDGLRRGLGLDRASEDTGQTHESREQWRYEHGLE